MDGIIKSSGLLPLSRSLEGISAVIFDMDGTMFNTEPLHARALKRTLATLGKNFSEDFLLQEYYGMADNKVFQKIMENATGEEILGLVEDKNQKLLDILGELTEAQLQTLITPGLKEALEALHHKNYTLAVVSASETAIVEKLIAVTGFSRFFSIIAARQETFLSKPFASPYLFAMRKMLKKCSEVLIFEDSPTGLAAAISSGGRVIRVGSFSPVDNPQEGGLQVIDNFLWLVKLVYL